MKQPIGIDLGTAYTRAAVFDGNDCTLICAMPSYVAFTDSGLLVGEDAKSQALKNPTNTIFDVIRLIGRCYSDLSVQNDMRFWPFKVIAGSDESLQVEVNWKGKIWQFKAVEICSMLLMQIKERAEEKLGTTVTHAVITVPVCFNYKQRLVIMQAGKIACLNFLQIINAPAASAFFYGLERSFKSTNIISNFSHSGFKSETKEYNMFIFDLGAGTLDVAVVTIKEDTCKVRALRGDIHFGGSDFDNKLVDYFVSSLKEKGREDISNMPMAINNLKILCEKAKISLSSGSMMVPIKITPLYNDVNFESSITVAKFNELNNDLHLRCKQIAEVCLLDSGVKIDAVHEVILAGSSARFPFVQNYIVRLFKSKLRLFKSKLLFTSEHLETATAYGAAFQAFFLTSRKDRRACHLSLRDAVPFSLGVRLSNGEMYVLIPKNKNIPVKMESTFRSNKSPLFVEVYEGDRRLMCSENNFLRKFELKRSNISSNINISFEIQESGVLVVAAMEIPHGRKKSKALTKYKIEDSKNRVWEALLYKENGKDVNMASTTKSSTRSSNSSNNGDKLRGSKIPTLVISTQNEKSFEIIGKSSRQHIDPEEYAIGIDFGTTYSSVAVWQQNGVKIIENEYGSHLTCSVVAFTDVGRLIGDAVHKEEFSISPANTILNIKRLIGKFYSDQSVQNDKKFLPFRVVCGDKNQPMASVQCKNEEKLFVPEEIAAMIFSKLKEITEAYLNCKVTKAVISVPASFSDCQRKAIKDAGTIAGLNVMKLLNEPTAIAITYYLQKHNVQSPKEKTLLIFDLGGGNLDVSIVTIKDGIIRIQAVASDTNLGGEDFDNNMMSHFVEKFKKERKKDISNKPRSLRRLRAACEKVKRVLSTTAETVMEIDDLDGVDFGSRVTRKTFNEINECLFKRSIGCVERCLEDAKMDKSCIDEVILVGGSTRIPKMIQLLQEFFNRKELCMSLNTDEAVVYGAAVQAAILSGNKNKEFNKLDLHDVTSLTLGIGNEDAGMMNLLIPKHT